MITDEMVAKAEEVLGVALEGKAGDQAFSAARVVLKEWVEQQRADQLGAFKDTILDAIKTYIPGLMTGLPETAPAPELKCTMCSGALALSGPGLMNVAVSSHRQAIKDNPTLELVREYFVTMAGSPMPVLLCDKCKQDLRSDIQTLGEQPV